MGGLFQLLSGGLLGKVNDISKTFFGDKAAEQANFHNEQSDIQQGYQTEFLAPEKKNWFNAFVDGANRLVRPFFTYGIIALFTWASIDPISFVQTIQALAVIPELMWYIFLTIVAFWFGGRILEKAPAKITSAEIATMKTQASVIQKSRDENSWEDKYNEELKDTSKTMSNKAIMEWNKRNNPNTPGS
jgi:hypothetical protein